MRPPRNFYMQAFKRDAGMLSRVADSLYWMGRYLERAEHTALLVNVELQLWLDQSPEVGAGRWRFLLEALRAPAVDGPVDPTQLLNTLVFSRSNGSSIVSCIATARENLRHVREQCSTRMWEQLNRLYLDVIERRPEEEWILKSHDFFLCVLEGAYLFHGITDATMSHGEGWQFIQLGRYIERASATVTLLDVYTHEFWNQPHGVVEENEYLEWIQHDPEGSAEFAKGDEGPRPADSEPHHRLAHHGLPDGPGAGSLSRVKVGAVRAAEPR